MLNRLYDNFTDRFGRLNEKKNLDLIKMDARGTEILSLERYIDGVAQKADIFHHPVAFNPNEITQAADAREALVASFERYAGVNLEYMAGLTEERRIIFWKNCAAVSISTRILTATRLPINTLPVMSSGKPTQWSVFCATIPRTLRRRNPCGRFWEATPKPIAFDDLDFNFGERWIPKGIYEKYASHLFDTDVSINFAPNIDEYSVRGRQAE